MYYVNEETGQKMYDHPLDEHYKRMFQEAKAKAGGGQEKGGVKMPGLLGNKAQDPLIRAEAVRKLDE